MKITSTLKLKLIYVFGIKSDTHKGYLKVGEATSDDADIWGLKPNSSELNKAAKKRIDQYTKTVGIDYHLHYTEVAIYSKGGVIHGFTDHEVHKVLERSGIERRKLAGQERGSEWFKTDLETVKNAIKAVKEGRSSLHASEVTEDRTPIDFRPEQQAAIDKTKKLFKKNNEMLWFAKMRFGKTLSALQVIKDHQFTRTLILTHRPVVDDGWSKDFDKIFYDSPHFGYGSKNKGGEYQALELQCKKDGSKYVYFASMQDLRGSSRVEGNFDKNDEIFDTAWDFIIIDEAHEGTQTQLGKNVLAELQKKDTKVLHLSGTPFNIVDKYKDEEIYTWDYVMEQKAKSEWDEIHFGVPNPYASLPKMNIYTYNLGELLTGYADEEVAFNFREFFRVNEEGLFIHEKDVKAFLDLICKKDEESNYPFATQIYRDNFRHSLWMVPGVKEAKALSLLMSVHPVFSHFKVVNVAGDGDDDEESKDALESVERAITKNPEKTYTITLSCGRLTTGVSVEAWTAAFMLAGSHSTSASSYMQTIFRVQTPATINGKVKEQCYVFDFAPDRTLKVVAEAAKVSAKAGKTSDSDRNVMGEFLNFCPIIAFDGSRMQDYDVNGMLAQLKKVYVERVVRNGFEDNHLYDDNQLMTLGEVELEEFSDLKKIIGSTKAMPKSKDLDINKQGFTDEEYEKLDKAEKKPKRQLTEEEKKLLEIKKEKRKQKESAISILRGISIRMPLMIYGAELENEDEQLSLDNFATLVDQQSWLEFMPKGVTKQKFNAFKKYYDRDVFIAAGKRIRALARAADQQTIEERIERITAIFGTFKNPDKETVLTPWRVVNMHLGDCLGGYSFLDEQREKTVEHPKLVSHGKVTEEVFATNARVLEINSKSGLYPLYVAYSIFRNRVEEQHAGVEPSQLPIKEQQRLWDKTVAENVFVLCKTPMAKSITKRTLIGFRNAKVNTHHFKDLINQISNNTNSFVKKVKKGQTYWKANNDNKMKFNAIVGNPPYQEMDGGNSESARPVYQHFVEVSKQLKPDYFSLIMPARWYAGGKGLDGFRESMINDDRLSSLYDFPNSNDCFTNVDIAGGLCYFLWDKEHSGTCRVTNNINDVVNSSSRPLNDFDILVRDNEAIPILKKILEWNKEGKTLADRVSSRKPFGLPTNYKPKESGIPCWFVQKIGRKYANVSDVTDSGEYLNKYKLIVPKAPIAGQTDFTKPVGFYYDGNTKIAKPGECCTESFIIAGAFESDNEIQSFKSYLFTKVVRFLLLQRVVSQDVTKKNFAFIPDFKKYEGTYTDAQLCELWSITEDEWVYIDSRINNIKGQQRS